MNQRLDHDDLDKLIKIAGMFGSAHAGERAAAAALATKILADAGMTWRELLDGRPLPPATASSPRWTEPRSFHEQLALLRAHLHLLDEWQADFVVSMGRYSRPTPKQADKPDELIA
jgi:hypothetical protein